MHILIKKKNSDSGQMEGDVCTVDPVPAGLVTLRDRCPDDASSAIYVHRCMMPDISVLSLSAQVLVETRNVFCEEIGRSSKALCTITFPEKV